MKIAVEGCCHGELDKIYETIAHLEKEQNIKVDLLLICGDFQAVRNRSDFHGLAVPPKFQKLNTFYKYYSGEKVAPVLTVFIGGNHEASNYLQELPYGGWVAPNIYYMGYAGVIQFGGVRIGGLSGIYKPRDYNKGHYERLPYSEDTKRSVYHVRNLEVFRLKQVQEPIDVFLSHDWPLGVYHCGNVNALLKKKPFFKDDIEADKLGSAPAAELLRTLQPQYWFSAHLHVKFAAVVQHQIVSGETKQTNFLALDKCLPRRKFLQVFDIPSKTPELKLCLDPEWLAILKSTNHLLNLRATTTFMPGPGSSERYDFTVSPEEMKILQDDFGGEFTIPHNFEKTAPAHEASDVSNKMVPAPEMHLNPQTTLMCEMLGITDPSSVFSGKKADLSFDMSSIKDQNPDEIDVGDDSDDVIDDLIDTSDVIDTSDMEEPTWQGPIAEGDISISNPHEISLGNDNEANGSGDENGGKSISQPDFLSPTKSPLQLPPPRLSGGLSLPKPICTSSESSETAETKDPEIAQTNLTLKTANSPKEPISAENVEPMLKSDAIKTLDESPVPPVKKFKRRNQSMYESADDE